MSKHKLIAILSCSALLVPAFGRQQPAYTPPKAPQEKSPQEHDRANDDDEKNDVQEVEILTDQPIRLTGRVLRTKDGLVVRVKGFGKHAIAPANAAADTDTSKKKRERAPQKIKMNDEIRLMRSAALEHLEEQELKEVERRGGEAEITPMLRLTGIVTVYKGTALFFLQDFKRAHQQEDTKKG